MLSIKLIGSSGQEVGYYARLGQEDYYVNGGEPPGRWCGRGATRLGLVAKVTGEHLRDVLLGFAPSGERLVQNAGDRRRRAAYDLTWSVPKSVSAAKSQADFALSKRIELAAERALGSTLEMLEELCGWSRRGKRGATVEQSGLVAAVFRHETSRGLPGEVPDPNLHFHLVLANVSVRKDGTTGSLDARELFRPHMKMALGALFRAELSKNLKAIGLSSHRPKDPSGRTKSWFELDAIPCSLVEEFSKRRRQIEHWLRTRGQSGAKASERAAMATRNKKEAFVHDQLRDAWQQIGKEHGVTAATLREAQQRGLSNRAPVPDARLIVERALTVITNDRARFSELELLRFAAQEAQTTGLGGKEIQQAVTEALRLDTNIVRLKEVDGISQFTTREMLAIEKQMLDTAERSRADCRHCVSAEATLKTIEQHATLRPEQTGAVRHLVSAAGRVTCVNGMAGTGKTFLLSVAREVWQEAGFDVIGTALAAKAAKTLEKGAGIESQHLHRLLYELDSGRRTLTDKTVVVLDEAAMVGTRMMNRLLQEVDKAGGKLALVGDHRQLQAISAGAPFRVLCERLGVAELTEITRQREVWARTTVSDFAFGRAEEALQKIQEHGDLHIAPARDQAIEQLVTDWHAEYRAGIDARIFAGTRLETTTINRLCQRARSLAGELGSESLTVGSTQISVNDRVLITRNDRSTLLRNGMTGTVTEIDVQSSVLRIKLDGGMHVWVDTTSFEHIEIGYCTTTHKGQGQTVDSAFVLVGGPMTDREITYVQGSRARGRTRFYSDVETGGATIESLAERMNRSRQKDLAHEYIIEAA